MAEFDNINDRLKGAKRTVSNREAKKSRDTVVAMIAKEVARMFKPFLLELKREMKVEKEQLVDALSKVKVEGKAPSVTVPPISVPDIKVPEPKVTVRIPPISVPDVVMPELDDIRGWVNLMMNDQPITDDNPLPVILRDADGEPVDLLTGFTQIIQGGGGVGGAARHVTIKDIRGSTASLIDEVDGALKVTGSLSATAGTEYTEGDTDASITGVASLGEAASDTLRALRLGAGHDSDQALRVTHATDATVSVNIVSGSSAGTEYADGATADPSTGTVVMGDTGEESANVFAVAIAEGATGSNTLRVVHATDSVLSTVVNSGTITAVTDITNSIAASIVDSDGAQYSSSNPLPIDDAGGSLTIDNADITSIKTAVEIMDDWDETNRAAVNLVSGQAAVAADEGEVDARTLRVVHASDVGVSVTATQSGTYEVVGDAAHDAAVAGNPVLQGNEARTTNPTAVGNGDAVRQIADDVGRPITRPVHARDLIQTAYVTAASEGPKTLLAGVSGVFHDLIYVLAANESDAAITLDITQTTSGTVQMSLAVPANGTVGVSTPVPIPQDHADAAWQVDNNASDHSNTTYSVTGLFSKEV